MSHQNKSRSLSTPGFLRNRHFGIQRKRQGVAALLLVILMVPLLGLLAFSVDYGYLLYVKTELQRTADQAVLAAARDLVPDKYGDQDLAKVRATVREYVRLNFGDSFVVNDSDIEIGRYDPDTIYSDLALLDTGIYDTVRVTLRKDDSANTSVSLYFARLLNHQEAGVIARSAAALQKGRYLGPGTGVFPFGIHEDTWEEIDTGDVISIYGNGKIDDEYGNELPGNWGNVDIGPSSNSTSAQRRQIEDGLSQSDINSLHSQGRISGSGSIDAGAGIDLNGNTGLSSGVKHAVQNVEGQMKVAPIYASASGNGNNAEFEIIGWAAIEIVDSHWNGNKNTRINVRKSYTYDINILPSPDLSDTSNVIEGVFTKPVLIQ